MHVRRPFLEGVVTDPFVGCLHCETSSVSVSDPVPWKRISDTLGSPRGLRVGIRLEVGVGLTAGANGEWWRHDCSHGTEHLGRRKTE